MNISRNKLAVAIMASALSYQAAAEDFALEEIVVTAQKKSESLMDVPVSVTAVTGEKLDDIGGFQLTDIAKATSGLQIDNDGNVSLRGVDSGLASFTAGQRVTTYFNGSYVANQAEFWLTNYDMDRIEILRGPQGTLYGASSPSGAIVAYPKKPSTTETEGYIRQTFGQQNLSNTQFAYSTPIVEDVLAIRIAGNYDENNSIGGEYLDGPDFLKRTESARFSVVWTPSDTLDINLVHSYTDTNNNTPNNASGGFNQGNGLETKDRVAANNVESIYKSRINTTILGFDWDLGFADFISQSYYSESTSDVPQIDTDFTPTAHEISGGGGDVRTYNQEFRLSSLGNEKWDWVVGAYHARSETTLTGNLESVAGFTDNALGVVPLPVYVNEDIDFQSVTKTRTESNALFTHNTFYLTDELTLIAGLRWNKGRRIANSEATSIHTFYEPFGFVLPSPLEISVPINTDNDSIKTINWTGTVKLKYDISEDQNVYLTYDRGVRAGSNTGDLSGAVARNAPSKLLFSNEYANSLELGYKASLMGNKLNISSALFHTRFKDFQVNSSATSSSGQVIRFIENAPEARTTGIDFEANFLATENLLISSSISYSRSKFEDFSEASIVDPSATIAPGEVATGDLSGKDIGGSSPRLTATFSANYSQQTDFYNSEWYLNGLMNFSGKRTNPFSNTSTGGLTTFDISTGLRTDSWDFKLWVKNVFDKDAAIAANENTQYHIPNTAIVSGSTPAGTESVTVPSGYTSGSLYTNPRQLGVTATYNF